MAGNFLMADTSMPDLSGKGTTEEKLTAIQNYLFLLLENLRYTLRNLSPENFNSQAGQWQEWADGLDIKAKNIDAQTIISQTFITNELYADYGEITDLTVDKLRTDYARARRYLDGDTRALDYIYIHDEEISFITAQTDGTQSKQLSVDGKLFYWTDESMTKMTCEEVTEWPVIVYVYTEYVKAKLAFEAESDGNKVPVFTLGVGDGQGHNIARIWKGSEGLAAIFLALDGREVGLRGGSDGYLDLYGLRRATALNFGNWEGGSFLVTLEGKADPTMYGVTLDSAGRPVSILYPDGQSCAITWG